MSLEHLIQLANRFYDSAEDDSVELIHKLIRSHINVESSTTYKTAGAQMPTIHMIRHGHTAYNQNDKGSAERLRGWLDIQLDGRGYEQAERVAQLVSNFPIARIVASDLNRARDTAKALQRYTNVDLKLSPSLRPFNMGICVGREVQFYVPMMLDYIQNKPDGKMEGSTESFNMFKARVLTKLKELQAEAIGSPDKGHIVVVAHSRNCRLLEAWVNAGCQDVETIDLEPLLRKDDNCKPGHFLTIQYNGQKWELVELADQDILDK